MQKNQIKFNELERAIGYRFADGELAKLALSHKSFGKENNERLEFLGDSLLNLIIAEALFRKFPSAKEGELSRLRSQFVKGETLAEIAREKNLGELILLGSSELKSGGFRRASILADVIEALIGAIYLDAGMDVCQRKVLEWYQPRLSSADIALSVKDPKTRLQEYMQERGKSLPCYRVVEESGQNHAREYLIECRLLGETETFEAKACSKRAAEKVAAEKALIYLGVVSNEQ